MWVPAKLLQSCPTLCDPMDCSLPGFSVHGVLQARILEWVAMPSSRGIFLNQGSKLCLLRLLHCRWILYCWATGEAFKTSVSSVWFSSVAQSCPTLCDPMNRSTQASLSITNSQSLPKPTPIKSVMPSSHLILCRPLLLLPPSPPSIRVF